MNPILDFVESWRLFVLFDKFFHRDCMHSWWTRSRFDLVLVMDGELLTSNY
ncbi:MAG: hypothetical protein AAF915_08380 [Cyanobacteria bacterium P01_D01_bin.50]